MRVLLFLLFPIFLSAQITRSYGVIEISGFPTSSTTGPKFAYNPADSSFYRWSHGSTWVKVIEPSIISAGWGIIKTGLTYLVDSSKVASRYYAGTNPTTIAANYAAVSNGTNLIARNLFDNNTYAGVISRPWKFGEYTTPSLPTGVTGYTVYNTTTNGPGWYQGSRWAYGLESTANRFTAGSVVFVDANGQATQDNAKLYYDNSGTIFRVKGAGSTGITTFNSSTSNILKLELMTDANTDNSGGAIVWGGSSNAGGAAIKYGLVSGGGNGMGSLSFYTREATGNATMTRQLFIDYTGNITVSKNMVLNGDFAAGRIRINNFNAGGPGIYGNITEGILSTGVYQNSQAAIKFDFLSGNYDFQTAPIGTAGTTPTLTSRMYLTNTGLLRLGGTATTSYQLDVQGTNAIRIPTGTVAQTPTESVGILRYNSDSTAYQGYAGGSRVYFATRAYARSLVAGLSTGTVTSVGLSLPSIFSVSGSPVTTSGTLSAAFTGGTASQFLRGDGRWMKSLYFNSADSIQFNITDPYFGSTALVSMKGNDSGFDSRWNLADYGYVNQSLSIDTGDDTRYIFDRSRGTISSPTALIKNDKTGGIYFRPYNGSTYQKAGYIGAVVDTVYSGGDTRVKLIFGTSRDNQAETSSYWRFLIESGRNISVVDHVTGSNMGVGFTSSLMAMEKDPIEARFHVKGAGTTTGKTMLLEDSGGADILTVTDNKLIQMHGYGTSATTAATLGLTESGYVAGFDPNGKIYSKAISSLADGNGIYSNSGTLANHTTRALIPSTGNLLFSQTYNTTDSAYIQVINNLDGNREIRGGLTDTASTGFSKFRFYQDEPNEEMGWEILTDDGTGTTAIGGQGGNLSLYADAAGTVEVRGQELRLNNGEVSMNQYGQGNMKASDLGATASKFVAKFSDGGKVLDYYLARDTFIEDVTLFSVGTLMNDCQELTIVSSMTATAPSHQEIRFPDAGDHLRGKKIIVYQKKKEAGIYVPQIKVVGGVSRLYFTTNTLTTDPSDQSVLSMDDVTWYTHGVTYEFTCLRIDNTPSYRWVLKQR